CRLDVYPLARDSLYCSSLCAGGRRDERAECVYGGSDNQYGTDIRYYIGHSGFRAGRNNESGLLFGLRDYTWSGVSIPLCEGENRKSGATFNQPKITLIRM